MTAGPGGGAGLGTGRGLGAALPGMPLGGRFLIKGSATAADAGFRFNPRRGTAGRFCRDPLRPTIIVLCPGKRGGCFRAAQAAFSGFHAFCGASARNAADYRPLMRAGFLRLRTANQRKKYQKKSRRYAPFHGLNPSVSCHYIGAPRNSRHPLGQSFNQLAMLTSVQFFNLDDGRVSRVAPSALYRDSEGFFQI